MRPYVARPGHGDRVAQLLEGMRDVAVEQDAAGDVRGQRGDMGDGRVIEGVHRVSVPVRPHDRDDTFLDVHSLELDVYLGPTTDGVEDVIEPGDARPASDIEAGHIGPVHLGEEVSVHLVIVMDHGHSIGRTMDVELDGIRTMVQCEEEAGKGVLDALSGRAPVRHPLKGRRCLCHEGVLFRNSANGKRLTPPPPRRLPNEVMTDRVRGAEDPLDAELLARWKRGDQRAATMLVERHAGALARFAASCGAREEIDELVQDTFVRAFGSLDGFRGESSFRTWLFTIERRLFLDRRRAEKRRPVRQEIAEDDVATEYDALESAARVRGAIARLTPTQREVFVLRTTEGLSYKEIAEMVGSTEGAARVHYHNAMRTIKELLDA
jgi:RNA polymerase sigma-70 factor, ECF subfamily